MRPAVQSPVP